MINTLYRNREIHFTKSEKRSPASAPQLNSIQPGNRHILQCLTIFDIFCNILYYLTIFDHISSARCPQHNASNLRADLFCNVSDCQIVSEIESDKYSINEQRNTCYKIRKRGHLRALYSPIQSQLVKDIFCNVPDCQTFFQNSENSW